MKNMKQNEEKDYVIVCTDQLSNEHSFLFWKPGSNGYTSDINKAGVWNEIPSHVRDIVIEKKKLLETFEPRTIVGESMFQLMELQKGGSNSNPEHKDYNPE